MSHNVTGIIFDPEITFTSKVSQIFFGNAFLGAGIGLLIFNYLVGVLKDWYDAAYRYLEERFFFTMEVTSEDDAFQWLLEWIHDQKYAKSCRNVMIRSSRGVLKNEGGKKRRWRKEEGTDTSRPELYFLPSYGSHFMFYKRRPFWFRRNKQGDEGLASMLQDLTGKKSNSAIEVITVKTMGFSRKILTDLITEAMDISYEKAESKTWIYNAAAYSPRWEKMAVKQNRSFDSVVLEPEKKKQILDSIESFRNHREWYHERGIPWYYGVLLYGPPGTGKTSTILSLAGKLKLSVCILNLGSRGMSDANLQQLMQNTPPNSIVLLEDVDSVFVQRQNFSGNGMQSTVTFSGLLNALDGIGAKEGRITFLSTNLIDRLDPALIRPGRVDLKVYFGHADKYQIKHMWSKFFPTKKHLGEQLVKKIPPLSSSPAELQGFYMKYKHNPEKILSGLDDFLKECAANRASEAKAKQNVKLLSDVTEQDLEDEILSKVQRQGRRLRRGMRKERGGFH